jgi:hypothetical protein
MRLDFFILCKFKNIKPSKNFFLIKIKNPVLFPVQDIIISSFQTRGAQQFLAGPDG